VGTQLLFIEEKSEMNLIRDTHGNVLAMIVENEDSQILNDEHGQYLGRYDKNVDLTTDKHGNPIGKGNQLMMLIGR
jgi:hypothetical protein